ncbi:uncharacterized protein C15orf39 homolog isoform X2 [Festucalex cinctus]
MPLFDETVAFARLSKSPDMSGFIVKPVLQYGGAHFSYNPRGKDAAEFATPWTNSSASLLDARSPLRHASGPKTGGDNSSDGPVFLAIPKAMYGHNPCCHDLGCVMRHHYSLEDGQRAANADVEHDWTRADAYRNQSSPIQQKAQDKRQGLQLDPGEEGVKRMTAESLNRGRPTQMEPNFRGYTTVPPVSMLTSLSEQSRHLQPSPRGYAGLHPSHATYEHMTSELYQECSPMPKYGHPTKHPMFYYPQANVEVENRTHCRDTGGERKEDVPATQKSAVPTPREYYAFPQTLHGDIPLFLHSTETPPSHSFVQAFGYPCYAHPGFHISQIRNVERPHVAPGLPSHRIGVSPSDQRFAVAASLQKNNQHVGPLDPSQPLLRMEPISPTRPVGQSVLPSHIPISRLYPLLTSRIDHQMDQPVASPSGLTQDRLLDYSCYVGQFTCPKQPKELPVSPRTRLPQSDAEYIRSESVIATANEHNRLACNSILKDSLKRHFPSLTKIKEEVPDLCESDCITKRQKLEKDGVLRRNQAESPEMPVIDSVFSLAPKRGYRKSKEPHSGTQQSNYCKVKPTKPLQKIKSHPLGPPTYICLERSQVQMIEPTKIKVGKKNQSDACVASGNSPSQAACSTIQDQIKPQAEDATLSDAKSLLVTQICETDKLECKPSSPKEVNESSQSPELPSNATTPQVQVANTESKPVSPLKPKLDVKTIPLECLKLSSTYNLRLPDLKLYRPAARQETPAHIPAEISPMTPKPSVRKHFLELHRALCKQVSKCVSATSEQQLRTWRSELELAETSSTKVQKVSCLLGSQARHKWLNKEISSALQEVLDRFREYITHERCPFPHVMRTGAVFLPMLVVKEILFPVVPGSFIDQVLQEHKVELRPTTLSEEKILIQLHKPCSSRLRRLMSLKHLPDVYADALNLLYYSDVCKHLDSASPDVQKATQVRGGVHPGLVISRHTFSTRRVN